MNIARMHQGLSSWPPLDQARYAALIAEANYKDSKVGHAWELRSTLTGAEKLVATRWHRQLVCQSMALREEAQGILDSNGVRT